MSAFAGLHGAQTPPPMPHAPASVPLWQLLPWQQPAHVARSHWQLPPSQNWPGPHGPPAPHPHAPALQRSARASQPRHAAPIVPQVGNTAVVHVVPLQQPLGHEPALHEVLHTPPGQPASQVPQFAPPLPHAVWVSPITHCPAWQHPFGQLVRSHVHPAPVQRVPLGHLMPVDPH